MVSEVRSALTMRCAESWWLTVPGDGGAGCSTADSDTYRDCDRLLRSGRDKYDWQGHRHDRGCASVKPCGGRRKVGEGSAGEAREGTTETVVGRAVCGG